MALAQWRQRVIFILFLVVIVNLFLTRPKDFIAAWKTNEKKNQETCYLCFQSAAPHGHAKTMVTLEYTLKSGHAVQEPAPVCWNCVDAHPWPLSLQDQIKVLNRWKLAQIHHYDGIQIPEKAGIKLRQKLATVRVASPTVQYR